MGVVSPGTGQSSPLVLDVASYNLAASELKRSCFPPTSSPIVSIQWGKRDGVTIIKMPIWKREEWETYGIHWCVAGILYNNNNIVLEGGVSCMIVLLGSTLCIPSAPNCAYCVTAVCPRVQLMMH